MCIQMRLRTSTPQPGPRPVPSGDNFRARLCDDPVLLSLLEASLRSQLIRIADDAIEKAIEDVLVWMDRQTAFQVNDGNQLIPAGWAAAGNLAVARFSSLRSAVLKLMSTKLRAGLVVSKIRIAQRVRNMVEHCNAYNPTTTIAAFIDGTVKGVRKMTSFIMTVLRAVFLTSGIT